MSPGGRRRARAFGHVQVASIIYGLLFCTATGAPYQRVIAAVLFFFWEGGLFVGWLLFGLLLLLSLLPSLSLSLMAAQELLDPLRGSSEQIGTIQRRLAWTLRQDDKIGTT